LEDSREEVKLKDSPQLLTNKTSNDQVRKKENNASLGIKFQEARLEIFEG